MSSFKSVLFDLDNTLYDNDEELEEWARERAQQLLSPVQFEQLVRALPEIIASSALPEGCDQPHLGAKDHTALLSRLVPGLTAPAIEFIASMHMNWLANMQLTPDAAELLNVLDANHVPYGIITNAPPSQRIKTTMLGLEERAKCIFISGEFGVDKPEPAIFRAAAECMGLPCDRILFIGDSPEHDVMGAHNSGMKAAWLRRGRIWPDGISTHEPEYIVESLAEVLHIVSSK